MASMFLPLVLGAICYGRTAGGWKSNAKISLLIGLPWAAMGSFSALSGPSTANDWGKLVIPFVLPLIFPPAIFIFNAVAELVGIVRRPVLGAGP